LIEFMQDVLGNLPYFSAFGSTIFPNGLQSTQSQDRIGKLPLTPKRLMGLTDLKKLRERSHSSFIFS